ncbi:MAG: phage tail fiber protein [Bdellovibrionota bacterium]
MSGNLTTYLENKILDHCLGTATFEKPSVYVGLFSVAPTDEDFGKEIIGNGYCRKKATFKIADNGATSNASNIDFDEMPSVTTVAIGIFDSLTEGNLLLFGNLICVIDTDEGDTLQISKGDLDIEID